MDEQVNDLITKETQKYDAEIENARHMAAADEQQRQEEISILENILKEVQDNLKKVG